MRVLPGLSVATLALALAPAPAAAADVIDTDTIAAVREYVEREVAYLGIPGAAVAVVHDDEIVFAAGYGQQRHGGGEITPDTPFDLASVSKSLTAVAVMQQVEAGTIDLERPIGETIAWFGNALPALRDITVRDLLGHQSGWSEEDGRANLTDTYDGPDALERNVRRLAATAPTHQRGTFEYSNANYDVLAYLVEVSSGIPFAEYMETRVFAPLEMKHSHATRAGAVADGLAQGHYPLMGVRIAYEVPYVPGAVGSGFLFASASDLAHALIFHLNGGRYRDAQVLAPEQVRELHRPIGRPDPHSGYAGGLWTYPLWAAGGLSIDADPPVYRVPIVHEHGGDHASTATSILFLPEERLGVVVLFNLNDTAAPSRYHQLHYGIAALLLGDPPPETIAYEDLIGQQSRAIFGAIVLAQLLGIAWAVRRLSRWRRSPQARPRGAPGVAAHLVPALVLDLSVAVVVVWLLIERANAPLSVAVAYAPDVALAVGVIAVLGVGWGALRTLLSVRVLRGSADEAALSPRR